MNRGVVLEDIAPPFQKDNNPQTLSGVVLGRKQNAGINPAFRRDRLAELLLASLEVSDQRVYGLILGQPSALDWT